MQAAHLQHVWRAVVHANIAPFVNRQGYAIRVKVADEAVSVVTPQEVYLQPLRLTMA